jgi:superfamily II helicase
MFNDKKICRKCNTEKLKTEFLKKTASPDGLQHYCAPCSRQANREGAKRRTASYPKFIKTNKMCNDCHDIKPIGQFFIKRSSADGHGSYCKPCWSRRTKNAPSYIAKRKGKK